VITRRCTELSTEQSLNQAGRIDLLGKAVIGLVISVCSYGGKRKDDIRYCVASSVRL